MLKLVLATFGNNIRFKDHIPINGKEFYTIKKDFPVYGNGFLDQIIRSFLDFMSMFSPQFEPIKIELNKVKMYTTLSNARQILVAEVVSKLAKEDIFYTEKGVYNIVDDYLHQPHFLDIERMAAKCQELYAVRTQTNLLKFIEALKTNTATQIGVTFTPDGQIVCQEPNTKLILTIENDNITINSPENLTPQEQNFKELLRVIRFLDNNGNLSNKLDTLKKQIIQDKFLNFIAGKIPASHYIDRAIFVDEEETQMHRIDLCDQKYIASSMPFAETEVFWRAIYQEKVPVIVKLTDEQPFPDMPLYWPNEVGTVWTHGEDENEFTLTCTGIEDVEKDRLIKRKFLIKKGNEEHTVIQLDFLNWADGSVPEVSQIKALIQMTDDIRGKSPNPMLVHCAAGMGRTGTFIAAHAASKMPKEKVDFYDIIIKMRQQRPRNMVENATQFLFLHQLLD